jgi:hypothetical protein
MSAKANDRAEARLVRTAIALLGEDEVLHPDARVEWHGDEPAIVKGNSSLSLGADGRLWARVQRAGMVVHGIVGPGGAITPVRSGLLTDPSGN